MGSILEALFYGNIRPDEDIHPKHSEYPELNRKISSLIEAYHKNLSPKEYDELEKLIDLLGQSTSMYSAAAYTEEFRLGVLMMIEVMGTWEKGAGG
ncbi:DUF6809 family protein [Paenibacillus jilunlii]|uniref:Uncharacterized protein n=1 Tax=Paenibacillus jilunlii TaxID=682956 RepID=A0A1G9NF56_9BACL|nr:DUF6809 family protein [Paenibacillus jilunlii]KWX79031.1 hypothetical protein AML91_03690 [Paenibacillus jilunlii]SDL85014.1 hypothetical protein SAMN05216191_106160 [Paenibacillus jilunlii]